MITKFYQYLPTNLPPIRCSSVEYLYPCVPYDSNGLISPHVKRECGVSAGFPEPKNRFFIRTTYSERFEFSASDMLKTSYVELSIWSSSWMRTAFSCSMNIWWFSLATIKSRKNIWLPGKRYWVEKMLGATSRCRSLDSFVRSMLGSAICSSLAEFWNANRDKRQRRLSSRSHLIPCRVDTGPGKTSQIEALWLNHLHQS